MKVTPMMRQYFDAKEQHPDAILFFRMGDFYEMFFEDAVVTSKELGLTLTARNKKSASEEIPMAGVPHHAVTGYINKLVDRGFTVAICEQLENPADVKGIVKRDVVRVVTPGVVYDTDTLDDKSPNYIGAIWEQDRSFGIAYADVSTGEFRGTIAMNRDALLSELQRFEPRELLICKDVEAELDLPALENTFIRHRPETSFDLNALVQRVKSGVRLSEDLDHDGYFLDDAAVARLFKTTTDDATNSAAAAVLDYIVETQRGVASIFQTLASYDIDGHLILDDATKSNLELTETMMGGNRSGSVLHTIDKSLTAPGGRLLRHWLNYPLTNAARINNRLGAVDVFFDDAILRDDVRVSLDDVYDLERLCGKVSNGTCNGRDFNALGKTLTKLPAIKIRIEKLPELAAIHDAIANHTELCTEIANAIVESPPTTITDGGLFQRGYTDELDDVLSLAEDGKDWILNYESIERERTGISNLKVKYNKVFGYFIDVTKSHLASVPERYIRKQTLTNSERYFTEELKEREDAIIGAQQSRNSLEYQLFEALRSKISDATPSLLATCRALAELDVLAAFAELARQHGYCRPLVDSEDRINIVDGRHPVVERTLTDERFVPNGTQLDRDCFLQIITGPNMAGKSTVIRQVALITLLAQMGCYVPAATAEIGVVDRIFSRVGASDNLARGHSTFMVEMTETANILNHATARSLVILDEIGRGTSTFDGLSIAWAVAEYLHDTIGAKTLFATHYHELTELIRTLDGAANLSIAVKEFNDDIIFLRKLVRGEANRSYGIQVGRLAGLPVPVVERAKQVLANLESGQFDDMGIPVPGIVPGDSPTATRRYNPNQMSLFNAGQGVDPGVLDLSVELETLSPETMTPIEALTWITDWKNKLGSR